MDARKFRMLQVSLNAFASSYEGEGYLEDAAWNAADEVLRIVSKCNSDPEYCDEQVRDYNNSGRGIYAEAWNIASRIQRGRTPRWYKLGLLQRVYKKERKANSYYYRDRNYPRWYFRPVKDFDTEVHSLRVFPAVKAEIRRLRLDVAW